MHRQQYLNARNTLDRLLSLGAVPIVNENDTVATDEIRFGDNDRLAALVANLARAKVLLLLTNAAGLHAADPRTHPDAPVIDEGARDAVVERKKSLLPVGVSALQGRFEAGDSVDVATAERGVFARGLVRYSATELDGARGRSTTDLARNEVIHRDQLIILEGDT